MSNITRSNHPKLLWPGIHTLWGKTYAKLPAYHADMFDMKTSKQAYEEDVELTGFGLAPIKTEGAAVAYDDHTQGTVSRYTHATYSLGFIITQEALEDNLYQSRASQGSEMLAFSMATTREIVAANVYNRAFNSAYAGGDGKSLIATDHPVVAGTQSNQLAVAADLSEASLEDMLTQIKKAQNSRGLEIFLQGSKLIIPVELEFEAHRILKSALRVGTGNNDLNAIREMGMLPGGVCANNYLTDPDAFFIRTNAPNGTNGFTRRAPDLVQDNDFDTSNAKMKTSARFVFGWSDFRGVYASQGA
jgi:hypothetical protein